MVPRSNPRRFLKARWVLPISSPPIEHGIVEIEGDKIGRVTNESELKGKFGADAEVIDYGESIIMPGLINLHTHIEYSARRCFDTSAGLFDWIPGLMGGCRGWTEKDFRESARAGIGAIARSGTTCIVDSSYTGQAVYAVAERGLRAIVGLELFGLEETKVDATWDRWNARRDQLLKGIDVGDDPAASAAKRAIASGEIIITVAPHAPYTVCPPLIKKAVDWANQNALPVTMHLSESEHEYKWMESGDHKVDHFIRSLPPGAAPEAGVESLSWRASGSSPVQLMHSHGVLSPSLIAAHCAQLDTVDIEVLRATGVTVAHCPRSNARLRNGIAPLRQLLEKGVSVGFGTDSLASNDDLNILSEARFAWNLHRAVHKDFGHLAQDAIYFLTAGAAAALGLSNKVGTLEPGKMADIAIFNVPPDSATTPEKAYSLILFGEPQLNDLLVAGRHVL